MSTGAWVTLVGSIIAIAGVLVRVLWQMARVDFRVEEMWRVFIAQPADTPSRGRRRYDRTINPAAFLPRQGANDETDEP